MTGFRGSRARAESRRRGRRRVKPPESSRRSCSGAGGGGRAETASPAAPDHARVGNVVEGGHGQGGPPAGGPTGFLFVPGVVSFRRRRQRERLPRHRLRGFRSSPNPAFRGASAAFIMAAGSRALIPASSNSSRPPRSARTEPGILHGFLYSSISRRSSSSKDDLIESKEAKNSS